MFIKLSNINRKGSNIILIMFFVANSCFASKIPDNSVINPESEYIAEPNDSLTIKSGPFYNDSNLDSIYVNLINAMPKAIYAITLRNGNIFLGRIKVIENRLLVYEISKEARGDKNIKPLEILMNNICTIQLYPEKDTQKTKTTSNNSRYLIIPLVVFGVIFLIDRAANR